MRNLPLRHRSFRAVFEHSWLRLAAPEKQAFQSLAIFEDSFTAHAAAAIAAIPAGVLQALHDKSLVYSMPVEVVTTTRMMRWNSAIVCTPFYANMPLKN